MKLWYLSEDLLLFYFFSEDMGVLIFFELLSVKYFSTHGRRENKGDNGMDTEILKPLLIDLDLFYAGQELL